MWSFGAFCDRFCVSTRLHFKLELLPSRETALHFFEQLRRSYPKLERLRRREGGVAIDEEDGGEGGRRVVKLDSHALKFAIFDADGKPAVTTFAARVLSAAPAQLSLSELDFDYMEIAFLFDLEFRGNHDDLIGDTFFADHPLSRVLSVGGARLIECQPIIGVALSEDCNMQAFLELRGRTTTAEFRTGEFEPAPLTVGLIVRRYDTPRMSELTAAHAEMLSMAESLATERVVPLVVQPLAAAIASRQQ